jgi:hypothetical protein
MTYSRRGCRSMIGALAILLATGSVVLARQQQQQQQPPAEPKKPSLTLKVTPPVGFSPLRVRAAVEVRDGNDDYADFYCAATEWDWGDGTISESSSDCNPYEAGKSTIQRRFSAQHVYRLGGAYRVIFRLKQKSKQVGSASANLTVRSGASEGFGR